MTTCRALTVEDYPAAVELYQALSTADSLPPFAVGQAGFNAILSHPGTTIIGAVQGQKLVGMATLHVLPNLTYDMRPYGLVENVATHRDFQGRGIGRAVMATVAQTAWDAGAYKIMLLTNQDRGASTFYEKLGYSVDEKHGMILRKPT